MTLTRPSAEECQANRPKQENNSNFPRGNATSLISTRYQIESGGQHGRQVGRNLRAVHPLTAADPEPFMPLTSTEPHTAQDLTLFRHALDTLDDQLCILDESGNIVFVNESWIRFAIGNGAPANVCAASWYGESYLSACQSTDDSASNAVNGIRAVLQGRAERFSLEYPCHSPTVRRWFLLRIRPISGVERKLFLVAHLNITQRKLVEEHVEACLCATP